MKSVFEEICKEINYQETFSYEERCDLFNLYKIPTTVKFIIPAMTLGTLLVSELENYGLIGDPYEVCNQGTSHSGGVASAFNKEFSMDPDLNKSKYLERSVVTGLERLTIFNRTPGEGIHKELTIYKWKEEFRVRLYNREILYSQERINSLANYLKDFDLTAYINEFLSKFSNQKDV